MKSFKEIDIKKVGIKLVLIYIVVAIAFKFIAGEGIKLQRGYEEPISGPSVIGEIIDGTVIRQDFLLDKDSITSFIIYPTTYNRINNGKIFVDLVDSKTQNILYSKNYDVSLLEDNKPLEIISDKAINLTNTSGKYSLIIKSEGANPGNAISLWYNPTLIQNGTGLILNNSPIDGELSFSISYEKYFLFGEYYPYFAVLVGILLVLYIINANRKFKCNKNSLLLMCITVFYKYNFLIKQLVSRDFKGKYKRSILGLFWSFLNPLLTMIVQYIVFSTIFKSGIDNFPVYLMIGIVMFGFFTESVSMGLTSIVGNAGLITKVYVPKYIYPFTRVVSSLINLAISLIPLMIVVLITRLELSLSIFLVLFSIITLFIFCLGMVFILSSAMVFFRDTQFLWNVISLIWMYATPLFYPETILPEKLSFIFKLNPMYHYIRFSRIAIIDGVSPEPKAYLYCIVFSILSIILGSFVFKKTQDKFIMYL